MCQGKKKLRGPGRRKKLMYAFKPLGKKQRDQRSLNVESSKKQKRREKKGEKNHEERIVLTPILGVEKWRLEKAITGERKGGE